MAKIAQMRNTLRLRATQIEKGADILRQGGLLAFPTETVYGLGADARCDDSVAQIYAAKGRPSFNPLIVHVSHLEMAQRYGVFDSISCALAQDFWPGPLTLVVPLRKGHGLSQLVTAGLDTVALRVPAAPLARELLSAFDGPIAAPSANISGSISPSTADHVLSSLDGVIDGVLDGGSCAVGLESTIVRICDQRVYVLRAGGLVLERLESAMHYPLVQDLTPERPSAPGQMLRHYATQARLVINCKTAPRDGIYIGFGDSSGVFNLSPSADLNEAAAKLFDLMHKADALAQERGATCIYVAPIPQIGLGLAINDRLTRAATP